MLISQSAIKAFYNPDHCFELWKEQYYNGFRTPPSEVMKRGLYFEHHLLGATRDGEVPKLATLKDGSATKAQKDLDILIESAASVMSDLDIEVQEVQPEWITNKSIAHPDALITACDRLIILDVKYTETKEDDKWNGWGDPEKMNHTQAVHYIHTYHKLHGEYLPFYYLVFGKTGWVKYIAVNVDLSVMERHGRMLDNFLADVKKRGVEPINNYGKCKKCPVREVCKHRTMKPNLLDIFI